MKENMAGVPAGMESDEWNSEEDEMVYCFSTAESSINKENTKSTFFSEDDRGDCSSINKDEQKSPSTSSSHTEPVHSVFNTVGLANGSIPSKRTCIDKFSSEPLDDLRVAVIHGNLPTVHSLLEKGIWVDSILKAGWTPLMYACSCGHSEIVCFLLERKADPNFHKDKFTPLMASCASSQENEEELLLCVSLLIEKGARVNDRERYHTTALIFAARDGRTKIVQKLLHHKAEVNKEDSRGRTALSWAASGGHGLVVRLLLDAGANPTHVSSSGQLPADYAYSHGHNETGSILEGAAAKWDGEDKSFLSSISRLQHSKNNFTSQTNSRLSGKDGITYGDLELFLTGLNLLELIPTFQEHHLSFRDLLVITDEELCKLGIDKLGVRKKILEGVKTCHKKEWQACSLPEVKQKNMSCPDAVAIMSNITKHLCYIERTVVYLRHQIQSQPRVLELGQEASNVYNLSQNVQEGLKNIRILYDEMRFFKLYLDKIQDNVEYVPADMIVQTVPLLETSRQKYTRTVILTMIVVTATLGGLTWKKWLPVHYLHNFTFKSLLPFRN